MPRPRILKFDDVQSQGSRVHVNRPPCFGKQYDYNDPECRHQCAHRAACGPVFRAKGGAATSVPARMDSMESIPDSDADPLPSVVEMDASDESFFSKLAYNAGLQSLEALIREAWYATRSVPRKRYFPQQKDS